MAVGLGFLVLLVHGQLFGKNIWYSLLFSHRYRGAAFDNGTLEYKSLDRCDFLSCSFVHSPVLGCDITDTRFDGSTWVSGTVSRTTYCDFIRTSFRRTKLTDAYFYRCTFQNVDFEGADLSRATFLNCTFTACNLKGCQLQGARFNQSLYDPDTELPNGFHGGDHDFWGSPMLEEPTTNKATGRKSPL